MLYIKRNPQVGWPSEYGRRVSKSKGKAIENIHYVQK